MTPTNADISGVGNRFLETTLKNPFVLIQIFITKVIKAIDRKSLVMGHESWEKFP